MMARINRQMQQQLRIAFWNADGVYTQRQELLHFLTEYHIDILLLNESHLKPYLRFKLRNYTILRTDRPGLKGGTAVIFKPHLPIQQIQLPVLQSIEATGVILHTTDSPIHLIAAYKPPDRPLDVNDLRQLSALGTRVLLGGDINAKHHLWHSRTNNPNGLILHAALPQLDFTPTAPQEPTHFPRNGGRPDVLDMALFKGLTITDGPHSTNALDSDHIPVRLSLLQRHLPERSFLPTTYTTNWDDYKRIISETTSTTIPLHTAAEIDQAVALITANIKSAVRVTTTVHRADQPVHPTPEDHRTRLLIELKRWARKRWQQTRNPDYKQLWNSLKKKVKNRLSRQAAAHWSATLLQLDKPTKEFWTLAKNFAKPAYCKATFPLHGPQGIVFTPEDKTEVFADILEDQFTVNADPYDEDTIQQVNRHHRNAEIDDPFEPASLITPREVQKTLRRLRSRSAAGPDGISPAALKNAPRKLIVVLTRLFNALLLHSYFPSQWKTAKIILIPKQGKDQLYPQNYRPISLLPSISKLFERLLHSRLSQHITDAQLFPHHQFGFRPGHDTVAQLVRVVENITLQFNNKGHSLGIFLDIAKAFDRVWHKGLLFKLHNMGFHHQYLRLIHSYLHNRSFFVSHQDSISSTRPITAGVPQGSVLGPLLFNLFTSDIPIHRRTTIATFADDTAIFASHRNLQFARSCAQQHLDAVAEWTSKWRIKVNADKTAAVHFTRNYTPSPQQLTFSGNQIEYQNSAKYLGVDLDRRLLFNIHIGRAAAKATTRIISLYPLLRSPNLTMEARQHIFLMMIRPVLTYASPAWSHAATTHLTKLQRVQNRAARLISGHSRDTRIIQIHEDLYLPLLHEVIQDQCQSFWRRMSASQHPALQILGTPIPNRRTHRMPRPP